MTTSCGELRTQHEQHEQHVEQYDGPGDGPCAGAEPPLGRGDVRTGVARQQRDQASGDGSGVGRVDGPPGSAAISDPSL